MDEAKQAAGTKGVSGKTLALLSALYFVEGVPWGLQSQALPIFLREHHESLTMIGSETVSSPVNASACHGASGAMLTSLPPPCGMCATTRL